MRRGFSLLEIVIYIGILVMLTYMSVNVVIAMNRAYHSLASSIAIESSAEASLERMTREARDATSIDIAQSTLGTSPGVLFLNTTDANGVATTIKFSLSGQTLRVTENGTDVGPLTATNVRVTNLIFRKITTAQSQAVKIDLTLESGTSTSYESKIFNATTVLRGSYPLQ